MELELWAAIAEAPAYEVSTHGRVRRGDVDVATWPNKAGYYVVNLEIPGRMNPALRYVHRLVLAAFGRAPDAVGESNQLQGNHDDGNKAHNDLVNLEWVTPRGNVQHAWDRGLQPRVREKRTVCRFGHPLTQVYRQRDRRGEVQTWRRCARCRRAHYQRAQAARRQRAWLFPELDAEVERPPTRV